MVHYNGHRPIKGGIKDINLKRKNILKYIEISIALVDHWSVVCSNSSLVGEQ